MRARHVWALVLALGALGSACGPDRAAEARQLFDEQVAPILARSCGTNACHAASDMQFPTLPASYFVFPVDEQGQISGSERLEKARLRAQDKLSAEGPQFSELVRKPLDEALGGRAHRGGSQFRSMTDGDLQTLMRWAELARPGEPPELSALARRFAREIQPVLQQKRCMIANCHGSGASNFLSLDPGYLGQFDAQATQRNYEKVVFFFNLETPDAGQSRLVRKTTPQNAGGIFHRGGNAFFQPGDPELETILAFIRDARAETGSGEDGVVRGIVFAATDPTPRKLFEIDTWQPGGDLYSLVPAAPDGLLSNLTAAHHSGPADIRDPAVSHDGRKLAFAMRTSPEDCLNVYVMGLDGGGLTQLTHDSGRLASGIKVSNVEPLWGPDDRLYFISTRADHLAQGGHYPVSNVWRMNADGSGLVRMTFSADSELAPEWRFYHHPGKAGPEQRTLDLTLTGMRGTGAARHAPLMRVPPDFRADYHPHYGTQNPTYEVFTAASTFPDDREVLILADEANVWEGGALAIIDRNLGPVIKNDLDPAVVNYVDSMRLLRTAGDVISHRGFSASGYFRDPLALPDGTVIVSHSPRPIDHADPSARPDPALYRLVLGELPGNDVRIARKELLIDLPGKVETDPVPIMVRRREEILSPLEHLSSGVASGELLNFDLAVGLTVASEDSPSGTKDFDATAEGFRYVRFVEQIPLTPADYPAWPDTRSNRIGRGPNGIRRVLAEFPATSDRSVYARLPAAVTFFVQGLDDSRMATSVFNQWLWLLPGEKLKQVTRREVFNNRCGACHGSVDGEPGNTVATPDVLTEASRVVANYDAATRTELPPTTFGMSPDERLEVDYERDVQPILDRRCATSGCHTEGGQAPRLAAGPGQQGFSASYEALTAPGDASANGFSYVDPVSSAGRTSYLAEVIAGRELAAPRSYDSNRCPAPRDLTLAEAELLFRWLDLGASYRGIGPKTPPELPRY